MNENKAMSVAFFAFNPSKAVIFMVDYVSKIKVCLFMKLST